MVLHFGCWHQYGKHWSQLTQILWWRTKTLLSNTVEIGRALSGHDTIPTAFSWMHLMNQHRRSRMSLINRKNIHDRREENNSKVIFLDKCWGTDFRPESDNCSWTFVMVHKSLVLITIDTSATAACQHTETMKNSSYSSSIMDSLVRYSNCNLKIYRYLRNTASSVISISLKVAVLDTFQHKGLDKTVFQRSIFSIKYILINLCGNCFAKAICSVLGWWKRVFNLVRHMPVIPPQCGG